MKSGGVFVAKSQVSVDNAALKAVGQITGACLLVALAAQVKVPMVGTPVPMTLQTLVVLLTGFLLPAPRAAAAMLLYLCCGLVGLPWFAAGSAALFGVTGGYLVAFPFAAWLTARLCGGGEAGVVRLSLAGLAGTSVIFLLGVSWQVLAAGALGFEGGSLRAAMMMGAVPFIPGAVLKLLAAVTLIGLLRRWRSSTGSPQG